MSKIIAFPVRLRSVDACMTDGALALDPAYAEAVCLRCSLTKSHIVKVTPFPVNIRLRRPAPHVQTQQTTPDPREVGLRRQPPRALTDGVMPTDRVDNVIAIDKDHVLIIQSGAFDPGDAPTVALLDLSALQFERKEFFVHGLGHDEPLVLYSQNPTTGEITSEAYLSDALGSITELVDKNGTITGEIAYNSYGKIVHSSGNALDQPYSYTGREFDHDADLYYYRFRYYAPSIGRFLQQDRHDKITIDFNSRINTQEGQFNLYVYVTNNPLKYIDPTGLFLTTCGQLLLDIEALQSKLGNPDNYVGIVGKGKMLIDEVEIEFKRIEYILKCIIPPEATAATLLTLPLLNAKIRSAMFKWLLQLASMQVEVVKFNIGVRAGVRSPL